MTAAHLAQAIVLTIIAALSGWGLKVGLPELWRVLRKEK